MKLVSIDTKTTEGAFLISSLSASKILTKLPTTEFIFRLERTFFKLLHWRQILLCNIPPPAPLSFCFESE